MIGLRSEMVWRADNKKPPLVFGGFLPSSALVDVGEDVGSPSCDAMKKYTSKNLSWQHI